MSKIGVILTDRCLDLVCPGSKIEAKLMAAIRLAKFIKCSTDNGGMNM